MENLVTMNTTSFRFLPYAICLLALASPAGAQTVPSTAQPGMVEKRFEQKEPAQAAPGARVSVTRESPVSREMQAKLERTTFVLNKVVISGATVFTPADLSFAYGDMLGKRISLADAQTIVKRITTHYRQHGYMLSQAIVPSQNVRNGALNIQVVEGYIASVTVQGEVEDSYRGILASYGENIKSHRPLKADDLERYILLMDDLPGATAKGMVRPSPTQSGASDLVVTVTHKMYDASYALDNRGSKYVGPFQHTATVSANSLLGMYDRTTARLITTSPASELRFVDLQHEEQLSSEGTKAILTGSYSRTEPGDALKSQQIDGTSFFLQGKVTHPFLRSRPENLIGRLAFDTRDTTTDSAGAEITDDRLRVLRAGANYDFIDQFGGAVVFDSEISQGLDTIGATGSGTNRTRTDGDADFTKVMLDASRLQSLGGGFSILTSMTSQYSFSRLLAAEQFILGGAIFGRAYDPAELAGDSGVAGKVELRYGRQVGAEYLNAYQVYGFYDIGSIWIRDAGVGIESQQSMASAGLGVRTNLTENAFANLELAFPLTRDASNQGNHGDSPRLFVSTGLTF